MSWFRFEKTIEITGNETDLKLTLRKNLDLVHEFDPANPHLRVDQDPLDVTSYLVADAIRLERVEEMTKYEWDYRNRLTGVEVRDVDKNKLSSVDYFYNALDERIGRRESIWWDSNDDGQIDAADTPDIAAEYYVNDAAERILDLVENETDDGFNVARRYLYGAGVDELLAVEDGHIDFGNTEDPEDDQIVFLTAWTLNDHQNTVRHLYGEIPDGSRGILEEFHFDAFGKLLDIPGTTNWGLVDMEPRFRGDAVDELTGLSFNGRDYHDTETRSALSPNGFASADTNQYRVAGNAPINAVRRETIGGYSTIGPSASGAVDHSGERAGFWSDPLAWAYGTDGAIWDVSASANIGGTIYRDYVGEGIRQTLGNDYLAKAGGWELVGVTTAGAAASVLGGWAALPAAATLGLGAFGTAVLVGAAGGGAEYLALTSTAAGFNRYYGYGADVGPTWSGFGTSVAFGGVGGGVFHGAGIVAGASFRGVGRATQWVGRELVESSTAVAMRNSGIRAYELAGYAGRQFQKSLGQYGQVHDVFQLLPKSGLALVDAAGMTTRKMKLLAHADKAFGRSLAYFRNQGVTDAAELGRRAGGRAEKLLARWAARNGYKNVLVKDVPIGIGNFSSDAKWSVGKIIIDFKKTRQLIYGSEQSKAFKLFAKTNGYEVYYVVGEP